MRNLILTVTLVVLSTQVSSSQDFGFFRYESGFPSITVVDTSMQLKTGSILTYYLDNAGRYETYVEYKNNLFSDNKKNITAYLLSDTISATNRCVLIIRKGKKIKSLHECTILKSVVILDGFSIILRKNKIKGIYIYDKNRVASCVFATSNKYMKYNINYSPILHFEEDGTPVGNLKFPIYGGLVKRYPVQF